jgi:hypothetical protein
VVEWLSCREKEFVNMKYFKRRRNNTYGDQGENDPLSGVANLFDPVSRKFSKSPGISTSSPCYKGGWRGIFLI